MKNDRFRNKIDEEMAHVTWAGSEEVMKQIQAKRPLKAKRPAFMLAVAIVTMCMATALAVGLLFSTRYDAGRAAQKAIQQHYGISNRAMGVFNLRMTETEDGWQVKLEPMSMDIDKIGEYTATVSKRGKVSNIHWSHDNEKVDAKLDLADMPAWNAVALDKAVDARISAQEKEYRKMVMAFEAAPEQVKNADTVQPTVEEKTALARGKEAMLAYGFTEETLPLFIPEATKTDNGWEVVYSENWAYVPGDITQIIISEEPFESVDTFGTYTVTLGADQSADRVRWDRENAETGAFTKENWGKAKAYDKNLLPIVKQFVENWHRIADHYSADERDVMFMSLEDAAALHELYRNAGFPAKQFRSALPKKGSLNRKEALDIARRALKSEADMTDELLDASNVFMWYQLPGGKTEPGRDVWLISFHLYGGTDIMDSIPFDKQGIFTVELYADNGEVISVTIDPMFAGNG